LRSGCSAAISASISAICHFSGAHPGGSTTVTPRAGVRSPKRTPPSCTICQQSWYPPTAAGAVMNVNVAS
jgi:hypothetical protein